MKIARFQTFWIQMRKNKPLDESRKTGQTSGTKMTFTLNYNWTSSLYNQISVPKHISKHSFTLYNYIFIGYCINAQTLINIII
ncbi:hypothetical protein Hanom_Chr03g00258311 [Helianthus anomalus]